MPIRTRNIRHTPVKNDLTAGDKILYIDAESGKLCQAAYEGFRGLPGVSISHMEILHITAGMMTIRIHTTDGGYTDFSLAEPKGNGVREVRVSEEGKKTVLLVEMDSGEISRVELPHGKDGQNATINIGSVSVGTPSVTNVGTPTNAVLNFVLPEGEQGQAGKSVQLRTTDTHIEWRQEGGNWQSLVALADIQGPQGSTGNPGSPGHDGEDGTDGVGIQNISSSRSGKTVTVTVSLTNGQSHQFSLQDGADGNGAGDMLKSENLAGLANPALARENIQAEGINNKVVNIEQNKTSNSKYPSVKAIYDWAINKLNGKADAQHTHTKSQITDFPTSMPASDVHNWAKQANKPNYNWGEIQQKPATYPPHNHDHQINDIVGLQNTLNSKSDTNHIHSINGVNGLQEALNQKAKQYIEVNVDTAYNIAAKVGTTANGGYTPQKGDMLLVNFVNGTQVVYPTLNIDGSGAKNIRAGYYNVSTNMFHLDRRPNSNIKVFLWYDGEYYQMFGAGHNSQYSEIPEAEIGDPTKTHGRLVSGRRLAKIKEHFEQNVPTPTQASHAVNKGYIDQRMDSITINRLTQQEYDSLPVKDPNTLYIVT